VAIKDHGGAKTALRPSGAHGHDKIVLVEEERDRTLRHTGANRTQVELGGIR